MTLQTNLKMEFIGQLIMDENGKLLVNDRILVDDILANTNEDDIVAINLIADGLDLALPGTIICYVGKVTQLNNNTNGNLMLNKYGNFKVGYKLDVLDILLSFIGKHIYLTVEKLNP